MVRLFTNVLSVHTPNRLGTWMNSDHGVTNTTDALAAIRATVAESASPADTEHVAYLADFIANSHRGVIK